MARERYLADTSMFSRLSKPAVAAAFGRLAAEGAVAVCAPVMFELGFAARSARDYAALMDVALLLCCRHLTTNPTPTQESPR